MMKSVGWLTLFRDARFVKTLSCGVYRRMALHKKSGQNVEGSRRCPSGGVFLTRTLFLPPLGQRRLPRRRLQIKTENKLQAIRPNAIKLLGPDFLRKAVEGSVQGHQFRNEVFRSVAAVIDLRYRLNRSTSSEQQYFYYDFNEAR
jgi:hypothetical protein